MACFSFKKNIKIKIIPLILCIGFIFFSCRQKTQKYINLTVAKEFTHEQWLDVLAERKCLTLSIEEKASQVIITTIDGKNLFSCFLQQHFKNLVPGGVLLFSRNIADTPEQVFTFLEDARNKFLNLGSSIPVFFAIDNEGGEVFRTKKITTNIPSQNDIAIYFSENEALQLYESLSLQLKCLGINVNFAPVVETLNSRNNIFLQNRSFSKDPLKVINFSKQHIIAHKKNKVLPVIKHFPGNTELDPHFTIPKFNVDKKQLYEEINKSFTPLILTNQIDALMLSHIIIPEIDSVPFCFSKNGIQEILIEYLHYDGIIITDDVSMDAIKQLDITTVQAGLLALEAGCDLVLTTDPNIKPLVLAIKKWALTNTKNYKRLEEAVTKILKTKYKYKILPTPQQTYYFNYKKEIKKFNSDLFYETYTKGNILVQELYLKK